MNPYKTLNAEHFWSKQVAGQQEHSILYDAAPKFRFNLEEDRFATAGSCFAQHFARELTARGGNYMVAEQSHPLLKGQQHGYGLFSARYGNIYSVRQLWELLAQAFGKRDPIFDLVQGDAGRWFDQLRPRAVPGGFSSREEAMNDRMYHLRAVRKMLTDATVFVFTLGLTETWENSASEYVYPICPGTALGAFDPDLHSFSNLGFEENRDYLGKVCSLLAEVAPQLKTLLTVSPVMLVATMEEKGAIQASMVSKSILRAAADDCVRRFDSVDYFPSYEIIAGPQAPRSFYQPGSRDVAPEGVACVMDHFFATRMRGAKREPQAQVDREQVDTAEALAEAFEVECDEIFLDR